MNQEIWDLLIKFSTVKSLFLTLTTCLWIRSMSHIESISLRKFPCPPYSPYATCRRFSSTRRRLRRWSSRRCSEIGKWAPRKPWPTSWSCWGGWKGRPRVYEPEEGWGLTDLLLSLPIAPNINRGRVGLWFTDMRFTRRKRFRERVYLIFRQLPVMGKAYSWDFVLGLNVMSVQRWPKKFVLGCVIPPLAAGVTSRNLGKTLFAISVDTHTAPEEDARWNLDTNQNSSRIW